MENEIHKSVIIGGNVKIGLHNIIEEGVKLCDNVTVGNFNHIKRGSVYDSGTVIGNYCELGEDLTVGKDVIIQGRIRTANNCDIEDNVTIKYGTILTSSVLLKRTVS